MLTKADFTQAIADAISEYPAIAPLYHAGDPRIHQHLGAMATMLAMLSSQLETAMAEPFEKTRDATVLADAAMRGIVRKATPTRVRLSVSNKGSTPYTVDSGRSVIDSSGLAYRVETSATVPAGGAGSVECVQIYTRTIVHTVSGSVPFYAVEIPAADDDAALCAIAVIDAAGVEYVHRPRYVNTAPGEKVFHVEADDRQRVYVRFGYADVVGVQPANGEQITLRVSYCAGAITPTHGTPFSFDYLGSPSESSIELKMDAVVKPGQNPPSMSVLRDLARYPSAYDENAVFMGEFDFLVRSKFTTLRFLSVWNEAAEERARGASVDNINTLFVACLSEIGTEQVLTQPDPATPVQPAVIDETSLTDTQVAIRAAILAADDSYKIKFFTPVRSPIAMTINASVATSYVADDVRQKIREAILAEFGEVAAASRRGHNRPLYQRVYALLRNRIAALAGGGEADMTVSIAEPPAGAYRPEVWRYVSDASLTVNVTTVNIVVPSWG